jgi:hypothetical protein
MKVSSIKFTGNPSGGLQVVPCVQMDWENIIDTVHGCTHSWAGAQISHKLNNWEDTVEGTLSKNAIFWDITLCSSIEVYRCFRETHCLHLECLRVRQERKKPEAVDKQSELYETAQHYIPQGGTIHSYHHDNLKSSELQTVFLPEEYHLLGYDAV